MAGRESYIVREGYPFILISLGLAFLGFVLGWFILGGFLLLVVFFVTWFFRNPQRVIPPDPGVLVSPADGRVIKVVSVKNPEPLVGEYGQISIFMNVFNVHVNRIPVMGQVVAMIYHAGRFFSANLDKASLENERNKVIIETEAGKIMVVQIAGLIARRIVCWVSVGDKVEKGERFGLIRFGSRVDVYFPDGISPAVRVGEKVRAGETIIGVPK
jgi:phosphatidylserine decarboxylase